MENKLILNSGKTSVIIFRTKQSKAVIQGDIQLDNTKITIANQTKFLGIYLDKFLDRKHHVEMVSQKLNSICYGIRVVGRYMSQKVLKMIYCANFESVMRYGLIFWGRSTMANNIFIIQKRVLRVLKGMGFNDSCRGIFKSFGILTFYGLYIYECLMFFFKNKQMFNPQISHGYSTRTRNINYPIHRLTLTEKSPKHMCLKLFNNLPDNFKIINSVKQFKFQIKKLEPHSIQDYVRY